MGKPKRQLEVLFIEDSETDTKIVVRELRRSGFSPRWKRVETVSGLREALPTRRWHLVISDSRVSGLNAPEALSLVKQYMPNVPFIVLSATITEELAVEVMRLGAADYVTQNNLRRIGPAVTRALNESRTSPGDLGLQELNLTHWALAVRQKKRRASRVRTRKLSQSSPRRAVRKDEGLQRELSRWLVGAQEMERRRIAGRLHDDFGQLLTALHFTLRSAQQVDGAQRERRLEEGISIVKQAIEQARDFSTELWPTVLDDLGLPSALRSLAERHARWSGLAIHVDVDEVRRLPLPIEAACYRLAQEALTNVARHAKARKVEIRLRVQPGVFQIVIRDDGKGFDTARAWQRALAGASLGLLGMRERVSLAGGQLEIESRPGRGTTVRARFPTTPTRAPNEPSRTAGRRP